MSVRVNLLPEEVEARGRANRARLVAGLLAFVVIAGLAVLTLLQRGSIGDAEDELAAVQAENEQLQAEVTALQPFADLEARAVATAEVVEFALANEVSLASVLQDLSLVYPPSAELTTLSINAAGGPQEPAAGGDRLVAGRLVAQGQVLTGLSPGVERLLIDFGRASSFDNAYVTSSSVNEEGVATFSLEADLGPEAVTERYVVTDMEDAE